MGTALHRTVALALAALAVLPAAASARPRPQPLVDQAPLGFTFKDRVTSSNPRVAHVSAVGHFDVYTAPSGIQIPVSISPNYEGHGVDTSVAQSYVDFLDSLTHGPELANLKIYIAPLSEAQQLCGGQPGTLACYDSSTQVMTVPGEQLQLNDGSGVTTSYIVAHEYGHHIAAYRNNDPFRAFAWGPKYWASYERVCDRTDQGLLFPGKEDPYEAYIANPGELWAETYAHLKYPDVGWTFSQLLKPDDGAFAAAQQDVLQPWTTNVVKTFRGSFGASGTPKKFTLPLRLDGAFSVRMSGPRRSNYSFIVADNNRHGRWSTGRGSNDVVKYTAVCRTQPVDTVRIVVRRISGKGPFTLRVSYPG